MTLVEAAEMLKLLLPGQDVYVVYMHDAPEKRCRVVRRTGAHHGSSTVAVLGRGDTYEEALEEARDRENH